MTLTEEARIMARQKTLEEIRELSKGRRPTDVEHLASIFAMENEIEGRMAVKKAKAAKKEAKLDAGRVKAEALYINAREKLRVEKMRHCIAKQGFAEEKARHRAERDRHAKAKAQFQRDAEPWREIQREEKEEARAIQAAADKDVDDFVAEQS